MSREARAVLETEMDLTDYEFKSEFFRRKIAAEVEKHAEKLAVDLAAKSVAKSVAKAMGRSLLAVLTARGFSVGEELRAQIAACTDTTTLERWTSRATTATSAEEALREA